MTGYAAGRHWFQQGRRCWWVVVRRWRRARYHDGGGDLARGVEMAS
jgi:hypothetical protein